MDCCLNKWVASVLFGKTQSVSVGAALHIVFYIFINILVPILSTPLATPLPSDWVVLPRFCPLTDVALESSSKHCNRWLRYWVCTRVTMWTQDIAQDTVSLGAPRYGTVPQIQSSWHLWAYQYLNAKATLIFCFQAFDPAGNNSCPRVTTLIHWHCIVSVEKQCCQFRLPPL